VARRTPPLPSETRPMKNSESPILRFQCMNGKTRPGSRGASCRMPAGSQNHPVGGLRPGMGETPAPGLVGEADVTPAHPATRCVHRGYTQPSGQPQPEPAKIAEARLGWATRCSVCGEPPDQALFAAGFPRPWRGDAQQASQERPVRAGVMLKGHPDIILAVGCASFGGKRRSPSSSSPIR